MTTEIHIRDRPLKLYAYGLRLKPGTEEKVQYRRGPFANLKEWHNFGYTKAGRNMQRGTYALVDELTDPPTLWHGGDVDLETKEWSPLGGLVLPYPFLIRRLDNELLTGDGTTIFEGER